MHEAVNDALHATCVTAAFSGRKKYISFSFPVNMFSALRCQTRNSLRFGSRRWLATEIALPNTVSKEFVKEAQSRTRDLVDAEPEISEEEQKERYNAFLDEKAKERPLRPHLGVEVDPNHGLWAFFRKVEKDGQETYETVERDSPGQTSGSGEHRVIHLITTSSDTAVRTILECI